VAFLLQPQLWGLVLLLLALISLVGGAYPALVLSRVRPVESLRAGTVRAGRASCQPYSSACSLQRPASCWWWHC